MPHNTTPHPIDETEKVKRGAALAAKKAIGSQLEGASDDEGGEDSASDSGLYSASDDEGDDGEEEGEEEGGEEEGEEEGEDAAASDGGSGYGFNCS